jgi:ubiquinone/menaquinone biosynthesis C-methylase UbiE
MSEINTAATAGFGDAEAYEQVMGRWSRSLAPLLIRFGGLSDGDRVLDVGCGTGSLTFTLPEIANVASVTGIDLTESFVEFARGRNTDPRISFQTADARALPFENNFFDRGFSMLVLQFIPDAARAVAEMRRVVRLGGTVTAAVWDNFGLLHIRLLVEIAAVLDPSVDRRGLSQSLTVSNEMAELWRELGFQHVEQTSLLIRMEYSCFDDYWTPFTRGEGPPGQLMASLSDNIRSALTDHLRNAYLAGRPDGPRSFPCVAWACRGTVPA